MFKHKNNLPLGADRFLAAFEGIEGGFAIGAGILAGLSFAGLDRKILLMTAVISIIVNGFNAAAVKYSTEHYLDELDGRETHHRFHRYFLPSLVEFLSYFLISIVSIVPLIVIPSVTHAIIYTCVVTVLILFAAGYWRAYLLGMPRWRDALETGLLGLGIITVGLAAGWLIHYFA